MVLFKEMASKGKTFLITSHQFDLIAKLADNFAVLKEGVILFNRPYSDILDDVSIENRGVKDYIQKLLI